MGYSHRRRRFSRKVRVNETAQAITPGFSAEADPATAIDDIAQAQLETQEQSGAKTPDVAKANADQPTAPIDARDMPIAPPPAVLSAPQNPPEKKSLLARLSAKWRTRTSSANTAQSFAANERELGDLLDQTSEAIARQQDDLSDAARPLATALYARLQGAKAQAAFQIRSLIVVIWGIVWASLYVDTLNARADAEPILAWWGINLADAPMITEKFGFLALIGAGLITVQSIVFAALGNTNNLKLRARGREFGAALADQANRLMAQLRAHRTQIENSASQAAKLNALMAAQQTTIEGVSYFDRVGFLSAPTDGGENSLRSFVRSTYNSTDLGDLGIGLALGTAFGFVLGVGASIGATGALPSVTALPALSGLEQYPNLANWALLPALTFVVIGSIVSLAFPIFENLIGRQSYRSALEAIKTGYGDGQAPYPRELVDYMEALTGLASAGGGAKASNSADVSDSAPSDQ